MPSRTLFQSFHQNKTLAVPYSSILNGKNTSRTLILHFQQYKTPAVPQPYLIVAFPIFNNSRPQSYLKQFLAATVPCFSIFKRINPHQYLISAFPMEENASCNLFLFLEQFKTPAVPYFSIFNRITPQEHLMSGFLMEENPSCTLFLHIEQYKTVAVPQPTLILAFS